LLQPRRLEDEVFQDLRFGLRMLAKNPGFTLVAVLTLSLGIGANTAIFSVVNGVLLRPLPYREPERLVRIWETNVARGGALEMTSFSNLLDWQQSRAWQELAAWQRPSALRLTSQIPARELRASFVSANYFVALGVEAARGRTFAASEGTPAPTRVAVISDALWQSHFGADPQVVGAKIQLEKKDFQVIGVMPRDFKSPAGEADLWLPLNFQPNEIDRGQTYLQVLGRLKPAVTLDQAQAEMDKVADELARRFPNSNRGRGIRLVSLAEQTVGGVRRALLIVFGAVGLVLLVACSNVANLFLVRATQRRHELAIRAALGASAGRLARQLLTEATLIALGGGALGLLAAAALLALLKALAPEQLPRLDEISLDGTALLFTSAVALLSSVLFGLAPALYACRANLNDALKGGSRNASRLGNRLQNAFVVAQVAAAFVLLSGAGLLTRSFVQLVKADPGFHTEGVLVARMVLGAEYREDYRQVAYFRELTEQLRNLPGVSAAGAATVLPLNPFGIDFDVPYLRTDEAELPRAAAPKAKFRAATPGYFQAIGMPLVQGRDFLERDRHDAPKVVIVNQQLAERVWPNENPVGKQLRFFWADWKTYEVVGVAGNAKSYGLAEGWQPELFVPHAQIPYTVMNVVVHTTGDPATLADAVQRTILALDPYQPLHSLTTIKALVADSLKRERFAMTALGVLAALALALACVGLYSVISYVTARRTREIGIRLALGAQPREVVKLTVGQGMRLTLGGITLGLGGAIAMTRVLAGLLYGVTATDALTFAGVSTLLFTTALFACWIPARRAAKVNPLVALRQE
jgi:putative ABC transport system permease protein